jgi:pimeloyl-ACP methyl ester carboxylesterase
MTLATLSRDGGKDLVLLLHGIGCVKESFAALWEAPELAGLALLAPDLPGHGASQGLTPEAWTMDDLLAERVTEGRRLHLVAHSMGGAVGLLLAREAWLSLASFVNVEGNLIAEDCDLLSRRTAEMDLALFRDAKFDRLKARARAAEDPGLRAAEDPGLRAWAGWVEACPAEAFHASARSLVAWSDGGALLDIFRSLDLPKAYVFGERSANPAVLARLGAIERVPIADCGHFVMTEKPAALARVVGRVIAQAR